MSYEKAAVGILNYSDVPTVLDIFKCLLAIFSCKGNTFEFNLNQFMHICTAQVPLISNVTMMLICNMKMYFMYST